MTLGSSWTAAALSSKMRERDLKVEIMRALVIVFFCLGLASCNAPQIAVRGDSTAIGSRDGLAKIWNFAPSLDGRRWWNIVASEYWPPRAVFNDGEGGQSIRRMRDKMLADKDHRKIVTIIYDRRNDGEQAEAYIEDLSEALETLETDRFLILPQVPRSQGFVEDADQRAAMGSIDEAVLEKWPGNTFSPDERTEFLAALSRDETRFDGLHRNAEGQAIEARFIGRWLRSHGW